MAYTTGAKIYRFDRAAQHTAERLTIKSEGVDYESPQSFTNEIFCTPEFRIDSLFENSYLQHKVA